MRILALCKRRPQGRDLLNRPYGRFFHIPYYLAQQGHQVFLLLLSYKDDPAEYRYQHGFDWYSESLRPVIGNHGVGRYLARIRILIETTRPDWIVGFSDTWYGILAQHLGARYGIKTLIDAYDNYESYIPWAKPLHWAWRHACREASVLTAAGPNLLRWIAKDWPSEENTFVVPMAADPIFQPMDRDLCRNQLGLPLENPLVGYCGSLYRSRGIETLFDAIEHLQGLAPSVRFVFSGRRQENVVIPRKIKDVIIEQGYLLDEQVPLLVNALDVVLVINRQSSFGIYSYPAKLYEAMRCSVPVVATAVEGTAWILRHYPECLVEVGNAQEMANRVREALGWGRRYYIDCGAWKDSVEGLLRFLEGRDNLII
ncbi:Group 1 glycosyl transferase [Gammaproteobacteria bacterium]